MSYITERFARIAGANRVFLAMVALCISGCSASGPSRLPPVSSTLPATPRPMDYQCPVELERCPLFTGTSVYSQVPGNYVALLNNSGRAIQIDSIQGEEIGGTNGFGEYGAALDTFSVGQVSPGNGDVEWTSKESGYAYSPLLWSDPSEQTGLSVPPNHVLFIHSNDVANNNTWHFTVVAEPATDLAIDSWRQPRMDQVIPCGDGTPKSTVWNPWQNTTGKSVYLHGAMIYAPNQVDRAAISILDSTGRTRWNDATGLTVQGPVALAHQEIKPDELIGAQASLACTSGQWDWAAYLYISNDP